MSVSSNFGLSISISAIFITCFILSADICVQANENDAESITKIGQGVGHIMNIYYWQVIKIITHISVGTYLTYYIELIYLFLPFSYSCGYRKVFEDYAGIIQQKYPGISVIGANYDPPGLNMYMSRMIVSLLYCAIFTYPSYVKSVWE